MKRPVTFLGIVFTLGLGCAAALLWLLGLVASDSTPLTVRASSSQVRAQAPGDVYCVTPQGGTYPGCTLVFTNVQAALDAATGGETIKVATGTYTDVHARPRRDTLSTGAVTQVAYISQTVHLQGGYTTTNWRTPYPVTQPTTLDAQRQGRVVYVTGAISPTLEGLRVAGGDADGIGGCMDAGGGVHVISSSVTMRDCQVSGSSALNGGGVGLCYGRLMLQDSTVTANGPAYGGGGMFTWYSTATLESSAIVTNYATAYGGGAWLLYSDITLSDTVVISNTSDDDGGGLMAQSSTGTFVECTVSHNAAEETGGGLMLWSGAYTVAETLVVSNTSLEGAGLAVWGTIVLSGNTIARNAATSFGGGVYLLEADALLTSNLIASNTVRSSRGGGLLLEESTVSSTGNIVVSNTVGRPLGGLVFGGGMSLWDSSGTFNGDTIAYNTCYGLGGAAYMYRSPATMTNMLIHDNFAGDAGSGVYVHQVYGQPLQLVHSTIARNAGGDGSGVLLSDAFFPAYSSVYLTNTILVSHTVGITVAAGSTATLEATLWGAGAWANEADWGGPGTILTGTPTRNHWEQPSFVAPDAGNYHLRSDSAAVDRGVDAGVTTDVDGDPRPTGAAPDLGADEVVHKLRIVKQASAGLVGTGTTLTYTVQVTNTGHVTVHATVSDVLPVHVIPGGVLTRSTGAIAPGETWIWQLPVTVEMGYAGPLTNVVEAASVEGAVAAYTETVTVAHRTHLPLVLRE